MIKVRSPVGSFIVQIFRAEGAKVAPGEKLFQLDSEDEEQEIERLMKMKQLAEESVKQLQGIATQKKREILDLSISVSDSYDEYLRFAMDAARDRAAVGEISSVDVKQLEAEEVEAKAKATKARLMKALFDENVAHNLLVSQMTIAHADSEMSFARKKLEETTILSPVAGTITLRVGRGSYVKQGGVLATISP